MLLCTKPSGDSKKRRTNIDILNENRKFGFMDINLQNKKIELIQWLSTLNDPSLIDKLMTLRIKEKSDWWNEISTEEQRSIEKGIQEANKGQLTAHSNVKKVYEKWL